MVEEYDSIVWNNVWDVVPRPENKLVVSSCWLYKVKHAADSSVKKHKARFVSHGFSQAEGINYVETFAPVARIDNYFIELGFTKSEVDANLYHIMVEGKQLIIVLYVDDLILTGDDHLIMSCKEDLAREFNMKDMGLMHYFLGMEVWQKDGEVFVSRGKYANETLRRFHMEKFKPMQTPLAGNWRKEDATSGEVVEATVYRKLVGSLMYLVNTRKDFCYAVNQLSQAMVQPSKLFWKEAKHILRYLIGTSQYGLWYKWSEGVKLQGFTDAYWARSPSDRKSTSRGILKLGSVAVSWYSRKQRSVALNAAEVEYMFASQVACEAIWMQKILVGLFD
eukprot:PITA_35327